MQSGKLSHYVSILRRTNALGARGQEAGGEVVLMKDIPCSLVTISGREFEIARKLYADATHRVEMYGNPDKPINEKDVLLLGTRRLNVGHVNDVDQNGIKLELLCGEAK